MNEQSSKKILITGARGFIGKNLSLALRNLGYNQIFEYDIDNDEKDLQRYCSECDFVFHLAGINRPKESSEFMKGNADFLGKLLVFLKAAKNKVPILLSSSIQAEMNNDYGRSKKAGEDLLFKYAAENNIEAYVFRLPNVFGKWCKPNYNSAIATFCNNVALGLPIQVNDKATQMHLVYIDDVIKEFINCLEGKPQKTKKFCEVETTYRTTLGFVADTIVSFGNSRKELSIPDLNDELTKKLFSTYQSYLPPDALSYDLRMNTDNRGSFTEVFRTDSKGQYSINISKPGITKGNHWHNSKHEKFLVVSGEGIIRLRKIGDIKIHEYKVSGDKLQVIDIIPGYTHNIENTGKADMVTLMWVNEPFDKNNPDTFVEIV